MKIQYHVGLKSLIASLKWLIHENLISCGDCNL